MSENKELVTYEASSMDERMQYARMIAEAGDLVPSGFHDPVFRTLDNGVHVKVSGQVGPVNPGKVFLAFEYGAMLGLHPLAALMGIHVIEGKPSASAGLISSLVRTAGHRLRVTTEGEWDDGTFKAIAELVRSDDEEFTFRAVWTKRDAERAGLLGKDNWKNYPRSMAKARAITEVAREGAEEALLGVHYTPEELGASVDANGEVIVLTESEPSEESDRQPQADPAPAGAPAKRATTGRQGTKRRSAPVDKPTAPDEAPSAPLEPEKTAEASAPDAADAQSDLPSVTQQAEGEADPQPDPQPDPAVAAEVADRLERERIAAQQEADQRRRDAAEELRNPEVTPEAIDRLRQHQAAEVERQHAHLAASKPSLDERLAEQRKEEAETVGYRDVVTGQVFDTLTELDAAIKARHADKVARESLESWDDSANAAAVASAYEVAASEEFEQDSPNYQRLADACANQVELRDMYNRGTKLGHMNSALRALVMSRKDQLPES